MSDPKTIPPKPNSDKLPWKKFRDIEWSKSKYNEPKGSKVVRNIEKWLLKQLGPQTKKAVISAINLDPVRTRALTQKRVARIRKSYQAQKPRKN